MSLSTKINDSQAMQAKQWEQITSQVQSNTELARQNRKISMLNQEAVERNHNRISSTQDAAERNAHRITQNSSQMLDNQRRIADNQSNIIDNKRGIESNAQHVDGNASKLMEQQMKMMEVLAESQTLAREASGSSAEKDELERELEAERERARLQEERLVELAASTQLQRTLTMEMGADGHAKLDQIIDAIERNAKILNAIKLERTRGQVNDKSSPSSAQSVRQQINRISKIERRGNLSIDLKTGVVTMRRPVAFVPKVPSDGPVAAYAKGKKQWRFSPMSPSCGNCSA
jgi:chromosome segregation ATPase